MFRSLHRPSCEVPWSTTYVVVGPMWRFSKRRSLRWLSMLGKTVRPTMSNRQLLSALQEGQDSPASLASPKRVGVVVRPPHYAWNGEAFECHRLVSVDKASIIGLPGRIEVVVDGNFIGVTADSL